MAETRRDRLRRELTEEILDVAGRQLAEHGAGGVSWRGIAREVGMNPASLYTYFASMDDLYTALVLRGYGSLIEALDASRAGDASAEPLEQVIVQALAYRRWAVTNPGQFNLIFTDQIPGYAAPPDGPTVDAERAAFAPLLAGAYRLRTGDQSDDARAEAGAAPSSEPDAADPVATDPDAFYRLSADDQDWLLSLLGLLHGLVSLEVNGHLPPGVDHGGRFEQRLRLALAGFTATT